MRCENCGVKLPRGCTFCRNCNTPVKKKQSFFEKIGKVPVIIAAAVAAIAAVGVLFFVLSDAPAVKYEPEAESAKAVIRSREVTFFDSDGNVTGTVKDVTRQITDSLGTMFLKNSAGELFAARKDSFERIDSDVSDSRIFGAAENADVVYYEKDGRLFRYDGSVSDISRIYGIARFGTVSPDGSCAAWGDSERGETKIYVSRNGNTEELSGADEIVSITDDGSLMIGVSGEQLVVCAGGSRTFEPVCKCGGIREVSADRTKAIFTDEHNPANTYLYDFTIGERIFLYPGSLSVYSPEGLRPISGNFDLFAADVTDPKAGTRSLMLFRRDGSSYKTKELLDLDKVNRYSLSANGDRLLYLKNGTLAVRSTVSAFAKENVIADNVFDVFADSSFRNIYFITADNELFWSDGGSPERISLNAGAASMIYEGVCTFIVDGTLYYSENGSAVQKVSGIGRVEHLNGSTAVSTDEEQYITYDGKTFINTGIGRF